MGKNAEKKHGREKQELKTQLNNAEKTRLVEVQELNEKLEQNSLEAQAIVMKLKAALEFTVKKKDIKIQEKNKDEITDRCNAERKEKNEIIKSCSAEKKEKNEIIESCSAEIKALQSKNKNRKELVSDKLDDLLKFF